MDTSSPFSTIFNICLFLSAGGLFCTSALSYALTHQRAQVELLFHSSPPLFWRLHRRFTDDESSDSLIFALSSTRYIYGILFVLFSTICLLGSLPLEEYFSTYLISSWTHILAIVSFVLGLSFISIMISAVFPTTLGYLFTDSWLRFIKTPAFAFVLLTFPLTLAICKITALMFPKTKFAPFGNQKARLLEMLGGTDEHWTEQERRLLQSVLNFRNRVAREIMRPRVDLFCIPENLTLKQTTELLQREGYSRVPVFRDTIDTIVGVLLYKDVLVQYARASDAPPDQKDQLLAAPIKTIIKKVFYCPETKKISSLLQEFRKRQTHLAVVVDEYGGTSGLVTIEDILEEIVGEIADEYDEQEALFSPAPGGGWIVDARMNLLDVEEELGILIPQEEDYDTLAGYIFYRVGSIPQAGLVLHHDTFEIEILKSNDRMVEEVRIVPIVPDELIDE